MKIRPLHDRVIVKRSEEERTTASGIVIPDSATEKPDQGVIQAVGSGTISARSSGSSWNALLHFAGDDGCLLVLLRPSLNRFSKE